MIEYHGLEDFCKYHAREAVWTVRRPLIPHKCFVSGKWLWLKKHHKLTLEYETLFGVFDEIVWLDYELGIQIQLMM